MMVANFGFRYLFISRFYIIFFLQMRFLFVQITAIPLAILFRTKLSPSTTSPSRRRIVGALIGLFIVIFMFKWQCFNDVSGVNIQNKFEPACVIYSHFYRGKVKFSVVSVGQSVRLPVHTGSPFGKYAPPTLCRWRGINPQFYFNLFTPLLTWRSTQISTLHPQDLFKLVPLPIGKGAVGPRLRVFFFLIFSGLQYIWSLKPWECL